MTVDTKFLSIARNQNRNSNKQTAIKAGVIAAAIAAVTGGLSFLGPSIVELLKVETVEDHARDVQRIDKRLDAYEAAQEKNTQLVLDAIKAIPRGRR